MAYWLTNILQDIFTDLGQAETFIASGGSATTTIYASYANRDEPPEDDYMLDGTLLIVRDGAGASAAPEGQYGRISDYDAGTYTFTHETMTTSVANTDTVMVCPATFPLREMERIVNSALRELGDIALVDTSITTATSQIEYTFPLALKSGTPRRVQIQGSDDVWRDFPSYYIVPAAPGSTGLIIFEVEQDAGCSVKIWYDGVHPTLTGYNSVISETIPAPLIRAMAVERALTWINAKNSGSDKYWVDMLEDARARLSSIQRKFRIWRPDRRNKILTWS